ncbi:uncharacterized protein F5Z01DRAFT_4318 [Emericellopsis atlantica]|uniref:Uncharacterized protein n=1 Tax=Emericellopsis atlantica TaxID=2614577 RepID=A0A9P7ZUW8_9HYPO|nr:uncharacterized protein F5Z01DRAFT_4318 [Emericellopsis atlantica]KAG9258799.1 hypothetical protein F5Z01DRAFT_4318 [Emericellopsis atlantica]
MVRVSCVHNGLVQRYQFAQTKPPLSQHDSVVDKLRKFDCPITGRITCVFLYGGRQICKCVLTVAQRPSISVAGLTGKAENRGRGKDIPGIAFPGRPQALQPWVSLCFSVRMQLCTSRFTWSSDDVLLISRGKSHNGGCPVRSSMTADLWVTLAATLRRLRHTSPQTLQSVFLPLGPVRQYGVLRTPQLEHPRWETLLVGLGANLGASAACPCTTS